MTNRRDPAVIPDMQREIRIDEETGRLFWNFSGRGRKIGVPIGKGMIFRERAYMTASVAWAIQTGSWPAVNVHFKDGNCFNLRMSNLLSARPSSIPEELRRCGSYQIRNTVNGRMYVGSTRSSFLNRWNHHRQDVRNGVHDNKPFQSDFDLYGMDVFSFEIVEITERGEALAAEQRLLDKLSAEDRSLLYNVCLCSTSSLGLKHSEATKIALSEMKKGVTHTPEARARMAESQRGRKHSEETRIKIASSQMGHPVSEETREKIRNGNLGKKMSAESVAKTAEKNRGKKRTQEQREKISRRLKGLKRTPEQIQRITEAQRKRRIRESEQVR